mmetsp:Transcript_64910/g.159812  ORF Transcript_64910/g.159812 Transcript_64910/m.159812 type:complete len:372 (+) Transcript_64910:255-1370(+)
MSLVGAPPDLEQLGVAPQPLDLVLPDVAVPPHDLHRIVGTLLGHVPTEQLHSVRVEPPMHPPRCVLVQLVPRSDGVEVCTPRAHVGEGLAHEPLDLPEGVDVLAKSRPFTAVAGHHLHAPPRDPAAHSRQAQALDLKIPHHACHREALPTNKVLLGHLALVEDELGSHARAHTALVLDLLPKREAGRALVDEEEGEVVLGALRTCLGVDEEHVPRILAIDRPVGDPHFRAGDLVGLSPVHLDGARAHREDIGAGVGLRHAHAADLGATACVWEVLGLLLVAPVASEVVDEEQRVREVAEAESGVRRRELLVHDARRRRIGPRPAVLLGGREAEEAEVAELAEQRHVELLEPVVVVGLRVDLVLGEGTHHLP